MTEADKIAAVTACFNEFNNMKTTSEKTGISYNDVRKYVKFERLPQVLKDMKTDGKIMLNTALETADLMALESSDIGNIPEEEIRSCAINLKSLSTKQKKRVKEIHHEKPQAPIPDIIEDVRTKRQTTVNVTTEVTTNTYSRMEAYKDRKQIGSIPLAASELIEEGLERDEVENAAYSQR